MLQDGNDNKALCASARHFQHHITQWQQQQGLVCKRMTFICHVVQQQQRQGLVRKCTTFICCVAQRQQQQGLVHKRRTFIRCVAQWQQQQGLCAQVHDAIIPQRTMATMITTRLQQQHMSSTSPSCAGARASFCNRLRCPMATATKQQWQQQTTSVNDKASSASAMYVHELKHQA